MGKCLFLFNTVFSAIWEGVDGFTSNFEFGLLFSILFFCVAAEDTIASAEDRSFGGRLLCIASSGCGRSTKSGTRQWPFMSSSPRLLTLGCDLPSQFLYGVSIQMMQRLRCIRRTQDIREKVLIYEEFNLMKESSQLSAWIHLCVDRWSSRTLSDVRTLGKVRRVCESDG